MSVSFRPIFGVNKRTHYLARVVTGNRTPGSHLATLSKLHWLPIHDRIKFKIATMTHKAIHMVTPIFG